jgi:uncharacterized protein YbjT (DUF2867 family)
MFVVLGASGNTGKVVAETLLRQKKKVRVVLHDAAKGKAWGEAGADVAIADVDEGAALERAFSGAEGVYVLLPPNFSSSHVRVDNNRRTNTIAAAVEAAGVPHVVLLSSVGAQQSDGTGPVLGLRDAETVFSRTKAAVTFVRAAYFMENWGGSLYAVEQGVLPTFLVVDKAIPLVATRDIGTAAARLLAEGGSGKRVIELAGPREYTPRDVAAAVGRIVGKPIDVQQAPEEAMAPALMGAGMNAEWASVSCVRRCSTDPERSARKRRGSQSSHRSSSTFTRRPTTRFQPSLPRSPPSSTISFPHSGTFASYLVMKGVPLKAVQGERVQVAHAARLQKGRAARDHLARPPGNRIARSRRVPTMHETASPLDPNQRPHRRSRTQADGHCSGCRKRVCRR